MAGMDRGESLYTAAQVDRFLARRGRRELVLTCFVVGSLVSNIFLAYGLQVASTRGVYEPYVIQTNLLGQPVSLLDSAERVSFTDKRFIEWTLVNFVKLLRSLHPTVEVQESRWSTAYSYIAEDVRGGLNEWLRGDDFVSKLIADQVVRSVEIVRVFERAGRNTWELEWIETTTSRVKRSPIKQRVSAIVTFEFVRPANPAEVTGNPIGMRITHFSWSASPIDNV